ncbi:hypothetical protein [Catenulispora rubra]|uniref:hypothetical protein n=1 Tax=Catenulispora rubra TaxID=280293 RepID=UPI001892856B|nr:hypothetical protein [Catenulispora rubra]
MRDVESRPVATGADLGPEHQGHFVEITTVVTPETEAKGLGIAGTPITVRGIIYQAKRSVQIRSTIRVSSVTLRLTGHSELMTFNVGDRNKARLFDED